MKTDKELINKLIIDTDENKIKWDVEINDTSVKATYEKKLSEGKKIVFRIIYYKQHTKSTKLHVNFIKKETNGVNSSNTIYDIGGHKRKEEVRIVSHLLNKVLLKEEKSRGIKIELEDQFEIGDRVVVIHDQDFEKHEIVGQKGTIIKELKNEFVHVFLVKFDNKFSNILISDEFNFDKNVKDGDCWIMQPENIKKIIKKHNESSSPLKLKGFSYFQN